MKFFYISVSLFILLHLFPSVINARADSVTVNFHKNVELTGYLIHLPFIAEKLKHYRYEKMLGYEEAVVSALKDVQEHYSN